MGSGIALVCAQAGMDVLLEDVADERIRAALATINGLLSRQVAKGSRLRLTIAPINSIFSEKNYNAAEPVAEQSMSDARTVTVTLFHDRAHPSALYVPLGQP